MYIAIGYDPATGLIEGLQTFSHPFTVEEVDYKACLMLEADSAPNIKGMMVHAGKLLPLVSDLTKERRDAFRRIDRVTAAHRVEWIPKTRGQFEIYMLKENEGRRYLEARPNDLSEYPLLAAEAELRGLGGDDLARVWIEKAQAAKTALARIEVARYRARQKVTAANSVEAVAAALSEFEEAITSSETNDPLQALSSKHELRMTPAYVRDASLIDDGSHRYQPIGERPLRLQ